DIANQLLELNETNNSRFSAAIPISQPPLPDLAVANVLSPTNGFSGQPVTLSWVVTNQGAAIAIGPWSDTILLATNSQGTHPQPPAPFPSSSNLAPGASPPRSGTVLIPSDKFGALFLVVQPDSANDVFETPAETNNLAVSPIRIRIQSPD